MFTEARKLHLIEEMIKLKSEKTLIEIEQILKPRSLDKKRIELQRMIF